MVWGLLIQSISYAFTIPIFLALYISASYMVKPKAVDITPDTRAAKAVPFTVLIGFALLSIIAALPAPSFFTYHQKLGVMALWQVFPIWTSLLQQVFKRLLPSSNLTKDQRNSVTSLRRVYGFALVSALIVRIATTAVALLSFLFPHVFVPAYAQHFSLTALYAPFIPNPAVKLSTIGEGVSAFLKWDETIGSGALLLWAAFLFLQKWSPRTASDWVKALVGSVGVLVVSGQVGLAVVLVWIRDEIVFAQETTVKRD
jgi:hypothetical protein